MTIRVLVADDDRATRELLAQLIADEASLELVATAVDTLEAVSLAEQHRPDVAVIDVRMPGGGGPDAVRHIRRRCPDTRIVAFSSADDREAVLAMLQAGSAGYVVKTGAVTELVEAIHRVARGQGALAAEVTTGVIEELTSQRAGEDRDREERAACRARIERVLEGGELQMVFQPVVDLRSGRPVAAEALARFTATPMRSPDLWFTEATRAGLGPDLELAAIRAALAELPRLPADVSLACNVSPAVAASTRFAEVFEGHPGDRIIIEVTEHAPVGDYQSLEDALGRLRANGIRLAVDDVGAGFASLRHIIRLRPELIKIDMSLTRGIDRDRARATLTAGLLAFAREIGAYTVAEGVETGEELETLVELGVDGGQGFLWGPPSPLPLRVPPPAT